MALVAGCVEPPTDKIMPYVRRPPRVRPGVPLHYATSMAVDGHAVGLIVESREGRPIKVEGNPEHPASLGATGPFHQASVLSLYDPDRLKSVSADGKPATWADHRLAMVDDAPSDGLWFILPPTSSPLVGALIDEVRARHPGARFCFHSPLARDANAKATRRLYGQVLDPYYHFDRAEVVLSLEGDFTAMMPMALRWARDFAAGRRLKSPGGSMSRLYAVEPMLTSTGSMADHRLAIPSRDVAAVAAGVAETVFRATEAPAELGEDAGAALRRMAPPDHRPWIDAVARDLAVHAGRCLVVAGDQQPMLTHVLAALMNEALGNVGRTLEWRPSALVEPEEGDSLKDLVSEIRAGRVSRVMVLDGNPVYTARPQLELGRRLAEVESAHLSLYANETTQACRWALPALHDLERWGDARAYDGTVSLVQPLIRPLYAGHSVADLLMSFAGEPEGRVHDRLRAQHGPRSWEQHLQLGLVPGTASSAVDAELSWDEVRSVVAEHAAREPADGLELHLVPSPKIHDGRFANNGWLQEMPHPLTKLTWDNAALVSPADAARLKLSRGRVVRLVAGDRAVEAPVMVVDGHAEGSVTLALGYGREGSESVARGVGVDAFPLRADGFSRVVELEPTDSHHVLAVTQGSERMHDREIALHYELDRYRDDPEVTKPYKEPVPTLLPKHLHGQEQWAMTIDTTVCTGCSACTIACQAENNVPVVGREGVINGREMHWLRIDTYLDGPAEAPTVIHQPMLCQHCENAPCEYVCPVNATVHSPDGLNEMIYNRCVGTRFCSNNCPYKVRRFNWLKYTDKSDLLALQRNPDVTVRDRGVMEKCSFCVQRIRHAERASLREQRDIRPGEVVTACQQACPTEAISFGSLRHRDTEMVRRREQPRIYSVLHDLGTRPRTQYLAKIHNRNEGLG